MSRVERHPGTFGVRRPNRSVSVGQAWADALLARAQQGNPGVGGRPDPQVPGWASNMANSTLGGILGQGSLPEMQRAAADRAAPAMLLPTPGGRMNQPKVSSALDRAIDLLRPLALSDLGVGGAAGMTMLPFPGLGVADDAVKGGKGVLRRLASGADEAVDAVSTGFRQNALKGSIRAPQPHADPRLWDLASGNHVGMGRQSGYTEADIQRWYLHKEAGLPREFSGETGERLIEVAQGNQRALSGLSDEVVAAAEETYEADRMAWDRIARDEVGELVQETLPGTSAREMQRGVGRTGVDTARGSLPWAPAQGVPRAGKPGLGGSGAPAADARPLFRTERPAGSSILESMEEGLAPAGSNYYGNTDGTVSRFKTKETAAQTPKPDQWGWMDPGEYRYVSEEATAAIRRQSQPNAPAMVKWEWVKGELKLMDLATGKSIGAVYDTPRVGFHPFSSFPDGRTHLGDRIAQVFQP